MRASLPDYHAFDRRTASRTRFTRSLVDAKVVLKFAPTVYPIDTGAVASDSALQGISYPLPECLDLIRLEGIAASKGVDACAVQSFIGVNVAETRQKGLVEQQGFNASFPLVQVFHQTFPGEA